MDAYPGSYSCSLFSVLLSLFPVGKFPVSFPRETAEKCQNIEISTLMWGPKCPALANFPVFFPDIREIGVETGSHCTASSASQMMLDAIADKGEAQLDSFLEAEIDQRLSTIVSRPIGP
jgi:hypothetical protein